MSEVDDSAQVALPPSEYVSQVLSERPTAWHEQVKTTAGWMSHDPLDVQRALVRELLIEMTLGRVAEIDDPDSAMFMLTELAATDNHEACWAGLILHPQVASPGELTVPAQEIENMATRFVYGDVVWPINTFEGEQARRGLDQLMHKGGSQSANLIPTPILIAPMPQLEETLMTGDEVVGNKNVVTLGAPVKDAKGKVGFISAAHAFAEPPDGRGSLPDGAVCSVEVLSKEWDAAFVACDQDVAWAIPCTSVMNSEAPGRGLRGQFAGQATGIGTAVVDSVDPILPYYGQSGWVARVYTTRATAPGDSGAVLVDGAGRAVGLAIARTSDGQALQFSVWMWMAGVLDILGVELTSA